MLNLPNLGNFCPATNAISSQRGNETYVRKFEQNKNKVHKCVQLRLQSGCLALRCEPEKKLEHNLDNAAGGGEGEWPQCDDTNDLPVSRRYAQ